MVTSAQCLKKYGSAELEKGMIIWVIPPELHIKTMPAKIYCNRDMISPLTRALTNLIWQFSTLLVLLGCIMSNYLLPFILQFEPPSFF